MKCTEAKCRQNSSRLLSLFLLLFLMLISQSFSEKQLYANKQLLRAVTDAMGVATLMHPKINMQCNKKSVNIFKYYLELCDSYCLDNS